MGRTFAVSDLHGRYDLWTQVRDFLQPDDTLYVIGDCADRGPKGFDIITEVYNDPRCIYIKGNHEELFIQAMHGDRLLHDYNGGKKTYQDWCYKYGMDKSWIKKLNDLPTRVVYINAQGQTVDMTHAGYTPGFFHNENIDDRDNIPDDYDLIWDREHIAHHWIEGMDDIIIVHGHTPIPYMDDYFCNAPRESKVKPGVFWYCADKNGINHKVNIDCGAFFTGHTTVLDLDTWEEIRFKADDCMYEEEMLP